MALTTKTAPTERIITTAETKLHVSVDITDDDALLDSYVDAATLFCQAFTKRQFVTATYELRLDEFPSRDLTPIVIPRPPLQGITSVVYLDTDGVSQTWAASKYQTDIRSEPGRLMPTQSESYPSTQTDTVNTVTVEFDSGYGAASTVPERFKLAVKMLVAHWYRNREPVSLIVGANVTEVPLMVKDLLMQDRMWSF